MKFSYSTGNLIFFGFLIILLILPIFDRHKIGKFQTQKSLLGIRLWAITYLPIERARCLPQINAIKCLGNPAVKIFERQTKATLEVKTRHFVTTFESVQFSLHQGRKVKLQHFLYRTLFDTHHVRGKQRWWQFSLHQVRNIQVTLFSLSYSIWHASC